MLTDHVIVRIKKSASFIIPFQILSMIEEAAGTRLYESKKEMAQKTIEKKDARLKEIDTVSITKS